MKKLVNTFNEFVNENYLNERRSNFDKTEEPTVAAIKDALVNGKINTGGHLVDVSVDSNNKNLPEGEYAIMPFTTDGDYWKAGDLKRFAEKVVDDLNKALKGKMSVELVRTDTGKSIRSWIIKVK